MRNVAMTLHDFQCWRTFVARVQTQVLGAPLGRRLALDHDGRQDSFELAHVMPIGAGHDERQGHATTVDQQVSLAPIFSPGRSD